MDPSWSNPQETMKSFKLRKRKRIIRHSASEETLGAQKPNDSSTSLDCDDTTARPPLFFSPKAQSPLVVAFEEKKDEASRLSVGNQSTQSISDLYPIDFSHLLNQHFSASNPRSEWKKPLKSTSEKRTSGRESLPVDLRLGTKLRLTMEKPFPWMADKEGVIGSHNVPITDEDMDDAMKISLGLGLLEDLDSCMASLNLKSLSSSSPTALLRSTASYHQFPFIYGVPVFPRLLESRRTSVGGLLNLQALGPSFVEKLHEEWCESIANLYASWKRGHRRTFYVLSPSFTALFASVRVNGEKERRVVITPTSSGFRHLLKEKGVRFSLPLKPEMIFVAELDRDDCPRDFQPLDDDHTVDLDHDEWLRDIGISPRRTLKLSKASALDNSAGSSSKAVANLFGNTSNATAVSNGEGSDNDDDSQESSRTTILLEGDTNINTFLRYLVDSRVGSTRSGPHSGLPATLLATAPFHRSTLRHLKISSYAARRDGEVRYTVELSEGPILPFVPKALMRFIDELHFERQENSQSDKLRLQVYGRTAYSGINEAIAATTKKQAEQNSEAKSEESNAHSNVFELEFDFDSGAYSWSQ